MLGLDVKLHKKIKIVLLSLHDRVEGQKEDFKGVHPQPHLNYVWLWELHQMIKESWLINHYTMMKKNYLLPDF